MRKTVGSVDCFEQAQSAMPWHTFVNTVTNDSSENTENCVVYRVAVRLASCGCCAVQSCSRPSEMR